VNGAAESVSSDGVVDALDIVSDQVTTEVRGCW
jgi:hypothetical protein